MSLQIKALEEDLGVQLFDRTGAHITLTEAGRIPFGYSQQLSALVVQAEHDIAALSGEHAGHLALGASTTIAQYVLPRLLAEFRREHPRVRPTPISGNTENIVDAVEKQKIALGFIEGPARSRDVKTEPFLEDELVLIASTAHEFAERNLISCSELAGFPLLMRERGSGTRHVIEMALERQGVKRSSLQIVMELDSTEAIKSAVEAGLGIGFVSRWAIAKDLRLDNSFKIVEVEGLRVRREFLIAFASGLEPLGLKQFWNLCGLIWGVQGGFFLREKPLEYVLPVYSNSETAIALEFRRFVLARAGTGRTLNRSKESASDAPDKKRK